MFNLRFTGCLLACALLTLQSTSAQEGSFLESLGKRLKEASDNRTDAQAAQDRENMSKIFSALSNTAREVIRALPEDSQQAIQQRRKAWMDAIASGVNGLTGDDIERWLENSDNVILKSLSRGKDAPGIDARRNIDRLPEQWWYGKQNRKLVKLLTEPPQPIVRRGDLPGPPIWFVNGIATKKKEAAAMADALADHLGRRVHLLHNPTFMEAPGTTGLVADGFGTDDLSECLYDRLWPATIVNRLAKMDEADLTQAIADQNSLQGNPTTRQLAHVLLHSRQPISLITHSQGCIIARNAMFTLAMLGRREQAENEIAWIASGIPMNDNELSPKPHQSTILDVGHDPIAKIVGMRGGTREYKGSDHSFTDHYLGKIKTEHLWDDSRRAVNENGKGASEVPPETNSPTRVKL